MTIALGRRYEIIRELGRGGVGIVFLARDRHLERHVAIKQIVNTGSVLDEAQKMAALRHDNIIIVYDVREDLVSGFVHIIMEYAEGGSLKKKIGAIIRRWAFR